MERELELARLKPNPVRDFEIDPLEETAIQALEDSIEAHGFFGGVTVCRWKGERFVGANGRIIEPGDMLIGSGHHRVEAALRRGIQKAYLFVADDWGLQALAAVYARENATQRGTAVGTARAGAVAAAIRVAALALLSESSAQIGQSFRPLKEEGKPLTAAAVGQLHHKLRSGEGIGRAFLYDYMLGDIPGFYKRAIEQDIASLKQSGDYARILGEVQEEIAAERARAERKATEAEARAAEARRREEEARQQAEQAEAPEQAAAAEAVEQRQAERTRAEQAAREQAETAEQERAREAAATEAALSAARQDRDFDFKGVAHHLKAADHIVAFRKVVTSDVVRGHLSREQQKEVAARLVAYAAESGSELSAFFIREQIMGVVARLKEEEGKLSPEEEQRIRQANWPSRYRELQNLFCANMRSVITTGQRIVAILAERPEDAEVVVADSMAETFERVEAIIREVKQAYGNQERTIMAPSRARRRPAAPGLGDAEREPAPRALPRVGGPTGL